MSIFYIAFPRLESCLALYRAFWCQTPMSILPSHFESKARILRPLKVFLHTVSWKMLFSFSMSSNSSPLMTFFRSDYFQYKRKWYPTRHSLSYIPLNDFIRLHHIKIHGFSNNEIQGLQISSHLILICRLDLVGSTCLTSGFVFCFLFIVFSLCFISSTDWASSRNPPEG